MNQKIVLTKQALVAVFLLFSATCFVSCEGYVWDPPKIDTSIPVLFQTEILPIFSNCTSCHGGGIDPDLRSANAYNSLSNGGYINVASPESSKIYAHLLTSPHNTRCSDLDRQKILAWIKQGALDN